MRLFYAAIIAACVFYTPELIAQSGAPNSITAPARLGSFILVDSSHFPDPSAGVGYTYADSVQRISIDVFVYPASELAESDSVRLERETDTFVSALALGPQRGWHDSHEVVIRKVLDQDSEIVGIPGRLVVYVMRRQNQVFVSYMQLFVRGGRFVKTRVTLPEASWRESTAPDAALALARAIAAQL